MIMYSLFRDTSLSSRTRLTGTAIFSGVIILLSFLLHFLLLVGIITAKYRLSK